MFPDYQRLCNFYLTCHSFNIYSDRNDEIVDVYLILLTAFSRSRKLIFDFYQTGICTTTDVDPLLSHMNNARYLRELDFARADFYERTNLYREICSQGSGVVQGAATIRYRRFLKPFSIFKITSKVCTVKSYYVRSLYSDRSSRESVQKKFFTILL